nr:MAG TPA: hypothetical protein [Caudoviricetes sp.]
MIVRNRFYKPVSTVQGEYLNSQYSTDSIT